MFAGRAPCPMLLPALLAGMFAWAGCTNVPELDDAVPDWVRDADYPALIPLTGDLAAAPATGEEAARLQSQLAARADGLNRRAQGLRGVPVLDEADRARLRQDIPR